MTFLLGTTRMVNQTDPGATTLDVGGLLTFSGGLFLLVFALVIGNDDGWSSTKVLAMLIGAAVLIGAFVAVELLQKRPMFDLSLFRKPSFTGVSFATLMLGAGMFAMFPYITLYLQNDLGYSPLQGGLRLLPATLLTFIVPLVARRPAERLLSGYRLGVGLAVTGLGIALMARLSVGDTWTVLLPGLILIGVGIGIANPAVRGPPLVSFNLSAREWHRGSTTRSASGGSRSGWPRSAPSSRRGWRRDFNSTLAGRRRHSHTRWRPGECLQRAG